MRNINRAYPGVKDGTLTEQIAYAITENMINTLDIDMEMDLHEASPSIRPSMQPLPMRGGNEYGFHGNPGGLQMAGINMSLEPSPRFPTATHRELGITQYAGSSDGDRKPGSRDVSTERLTSSDFNR